MSQRNGLPFSASSSANGDSNGQTPQGEGFSSVQGGPAHGLCAQKLSAVQDDLLRLTAGMLSEIEEAIRDEHWPPTDVPLLISKVFELIVQLQAELGPKNYQELIQKYWEKAGLASSEQERKVEERGEADEDVGGEDANRHASVDSVASPEDISDGSEEPSYEEPRGVATHARTENDAVKATSEPPTPDPPPQKNKGGRPRVLDAIKKAKIVSYFEMGLSQRQAAGMIGVDPRTIANERKRDPDFDDECLYANRRGACRPLLQVIQASQHSWRAAAWLIRNNKPCPEVRREDQEERDRETAQGVERLSRLVVST